MKNPPFTPDPPGGQPRPLCRRNARAAVVARPTHHSGWLRTPGSPWRLVLRRPSWSEAWAALIPLRTDGEPAVEKCVRPGDLHPEHRKRPR